MDINKKKIANDPVFPVFKGVEGLLPYILRSVGYSNAQEHVIRPLGYPDFHWLHTISGSGVLIMDKKEFILREGYGFFCYPDIPHEYYALDDPWKTRWLTFDGSQVMYALSLLGISSFEICSSLSPQIEETIDQIHTRALSPDRKNAFDCSYLIYRFILELYDSISSTSLTSKRISYKRLLPALSFMEKNCTAQISLDDMADKANVSSRHFCRLFKAAFGMRPFEYLNGCRIKKAKELLVSSYELQVTEVAKKSGFMDPSYFCLVFKEHTGTTPVSFRNLHGVRQ